MRAQLVLASAIAGVVMLSMNMVAPLVPLAAVHDGAAAVVVGLAVGAAGLLPLLMALPAGRLTERLGARRVVLPSLVVIVAGLAAMAGSQSIPALIGGQVLNGLGQFGATLGLQTFVANLPGIRSRNESFAVFGLAASIGSLGGPVLSGVVADRAGISTSFWLAAGIAVLGIAGALGLDRRLSAGAGPAGGRGGSLGTAGQILRDPVVPLSLGTTMALLFTDRLFVSFYPVLLEGAGLSLATIGLLISMRGLASLASRPTIGALTRRMDRWWLVLGAMVAEAAGMATVPASPALGLQIPAVLLCGLAIGYNQPLGMAIVSDRTPRSQRSSALSIRLGANRLSALTSPILLGAVVGALGLAAGFLAGVVPPLVAAGIVWRFQHRGGEAAAPRLAAAGGEGTGQTGAAGSGSPEEEG